MATKACKRTLAACACAQERRISQCFLQRRSPNTLCCEGLGCYGSVVEVTASLGLPFKACSSLVSWFAGLLWLRTSHIRQTSHFIINDVVLCGPRLQWILQARFNICCILLFVLLPCFSSCSVPFWLALRICWFAHSFCICGPKRWATWLARTFGSVAPQWLQ